MCYNIATTSAAACLGKDFVGINVTSRGFAPHDLLQVWQDTSQYELFFLLPQGPSTRVHLSNEFFWILEKQLDWPFKINFSCEHQ